MDSDVETPRAPRPAPLRVPGKRALTRAQNREMILEAARRVFAVLGYGATTVRDVIRATPLASGTFYNYFKSKEELFQALRDQTALALRPQLREARAAAETIEGFVARTFLTFFSYVAAEHKDLPMKPRDRALRVRVDTPEIVAGFEELRSDIAAGIERGLFPPIDPDYLTAAIIGIAFEMAEEMLRRNPRVPEETAQFATALCLGGIAALPKRMDGNINGASG